MVIKMLDRELFRNPPLAYRGTDLWMMNTTLDEDALAMQLNEMKKAGIGTFIARTYNGHQSDYPGEQYHRAIAFVIRKAAELQMEVYLQAGYMPSGIPDIPEKYRLNALMRSPEGEYGGEGKVVRICDGYVYYLYALDDMLDIMSKEAADYYVDTAYEKMWSCFRQEFGKTVTSVWVDEPYLCFDHYSWSPCLPEKFREMWGYDLTRDLPLLFDKGEEAETMRYRYLRCVGELLDGAYYSAVRNWCHDNGLHFSGHLMGEDTL